MVSAEWKKSADLHPPLAHFHRRIEIKSTDVGANLLFTAYNLYLYSELSPLHKYLIKSIYLVKVNAGISTYTYVGEAKQIKFKHGRNRPPHLRPHTLIISEPCSSVFAGSCEGGSCQDQATFFRKYSLSVTKQTENNVCNVHAIRDG